MIYLIDLSPDLCKGSRWHGYWSGGSVSSVSLVMADLVREAGSGVWERGKQADLPQM